MVRDACIKEVRALIRDSDGILMDDADILELVTKVFEVAVNGCANNVKYQMNAHLCRELLFEADEL